MGGGGYPRVRLDALNEGAIDAAVQAKALLQLRGCFSWSAESNLHIGAAGELAVCDAHKVLFAEILDAGDLACDCGDFFLHAIDDLIDGVFLAAIIEAR
jgi:hypothetical protein